MIQNTYLRKYITSQCSKLSACLSSIQSGKFVLTPVVLVEFRGRLKHVFASLHHVCTHKEGVSASINFIACEDVGGGDLLPFLTVLDIIKLINLMADPERFKRSFTVKIIFCVKKKTPIIGKQQKSKC